MTLTARGTSTHSSMPRPDNAIFALSRALAKLADYETPRPADAEHAAVLHDAREDERRAAVGLTSAISHGTDPRGDRARPTARSARIRCCTRSCATRSRRCMMNAGFRSNVIPGSAEATINVRIIPGTDPSTIVREIERVIGDPAIDVRLATPSTGPRGARAVVGGHGSLSRARAGRRRRRFPAPR